MTEGKVYISYDKVHILGTEAAAVLLGLNMRAELGYYLTEDIAGDDPLTYNNRLAYLFGFDKDLPLSNLSINIQVQGSCIVNNDGITAQDIEYDADDKYTRNMIIAAVTDSYSHDKIKPEIAFTCTVEKGDYFIRPKLEFILRDDVRLTAMYSIFGGDKDTIFGQFDDNDFAQLSLEYSF